MKLFKLMLVSLSLSVVCSLALARLSSSLPEGFVYLSTIDPSIKQDMRYATEHNFIGSRIFGYKRAQCILTRPAALALAKVQKSLLAEGLSLQVYDCYRPQIAVNEFITWSQQLSQQQMRQEFYPRVSKTDFFKLGYVASKSGHTRGSTVDLTIVPAGSEKKEQYKKGQQLIACFAPYEQRFDDGSIDMGTGFDCMDDLAHNDSRAISPRAYANRNLLRQRMQRYGFRSYHQEWWHFTLNKEPYPYTYFNFLVD